MARVLVCLTTVGKRRDGEKLATKLVRKGLAACVNIVPGVLSCYIWKGRLVRDREILLIIKTKASKKRALETFLKSVHPYETPEFIGISVDFGSKEYLKWVIGI